QQPTEHSLTPCLTKGFSPTLAQTPATTPQDSVPQIATIKTPYFEADVTAAPEMQPWGHTAEALCEVWYSKISVMLKSDESFRPLPDTVKIIFDLESQAPAYVAGSTMHVSIPYVKGHLDDFGMIIHELTHLVQRYRGGAPGWLMEGMADYVRNKLFEPNLKLPKVNFDRAKYTDSYKTTASFLLFVESKYGPDLIPKLHAAIRARMYKPELFKELTGKDLDELWSAFKESQMGA
ncbi:MAG: basic secretory protein-like protein, partial [Chthonomonadales bacterium]